MKRKTQEITVKVNAPSDFDKEHIKHLLNRLINSGMEDAERSAEQGWEDSDIGDVLNLTITV